MKIDTIIQGDCREGIAGLPDGSVHCIVTSPPYYGLRDYGMDGQLGLEETPEQFIQGMVEVFRDARRVLRDDGTLWLNIGDSYAGSRAGPQGETGEMAGRSVTAARCREASPEAIDRGKRNAKRWGGGNNHHGGGIKPKDLIGIPWMLAFALRADGWYLRQDIIWHKPNPMPESVTDRCTKSHEYIFLLSKSPRYYYDAAAIKVAGKNPEDDYRRLHQQKADNKSNPSDLVNGLRPRKSGNIDRKPGSARGCPEASGSNVCGSVPWEGLTANKRSVWSVTTKPFKEAHFATFPPELIIDCIKAGCPEGGIVLDPFMGAGTTALVAKSLGRHYIGCELNPDYIDIAQRRLRSELGLFS